MQQFVPLILPYALLGVGGFLFLKYIGIDIGDLGKGLKNAVSKGQDIGKAIVDSIEPGFLDSPTEAELIKRAEEIKKSTPQAEIIALRQLFSSPNTKVKQYVRDNLPELALQEIPKLAAQFGLPDEIAMAIAFQESGGDPVAQGAAGDRGLFQITEPALEDFNREYGKEYPFSAIWSLIINIEVGVKFLALQFKRVNFHYFNGIRAYNAGVRGALDLDRGYSYLNDVLRHINLDDELVEDKRLLPKTNASLT